VYAQQATPAIPEGHVKVYSKGAGVILPQLLPLKLPIPADIDCEEKINGKVELTLLVDTAGRSRNIMFVRPLGNDLDKFALQIADADRFTPGSFAGNPAVVAISLRMKIQSCIVKSQDSAGKATYSLRLRSRPLQELIPATNPPDQTDLTSRMFERSDIDVDAPKTKSPDVYRGSLVGGSVHAPVPLIQPEAEYTEEARKAKINGMCLISLIVDSQGMPKNLQVKKSLNPGLDHNAIIAVGKYRFKPAMKDGVPVPVLVLMEVNYKLW
jgi:TonB family protein